MSLRNNFKEVLRQDGRRARLVHMTVYSGSSEFFFFYSFLVGERASGASIPRVAQKLVLLLMKNQIFLQFGDRTWFQYIIYNIRTFPVNHLWDAVYMIMEKAFTICCKLAIEWLKVLLKRSRTSRLVIKNNFNTGDNFTLKFKRKMKPILYKTELIAFFFSLLNENSLRALEKVCE